MLKVGLCWIAVRVCPGVPILAHSNTGTSLKIARLSANTNTSRILWYGPKDALDFIDT